MPSRTLVICEKPSAARRIAEALDESEAPESYQERGVPYHIAYRGGDALVVVSALGHLFSIVQDGGRWSYPIYDMKWVPAYETDKSGYQTRRFIEVIKKLSRGVEGYVSACDYDVEGSLIAYNILRYVCGEGSLGISRRMRYSTLTRQDLAMAWETMPETLDYPVIAAGKARHEVDWLFGINLSRALTLSVRNATGHYRTLSIGRVQGPTLNFVKEREIQIRAFVPTPYWTIKAETEINGRNFPLEYHEPQVDREKEVKEIAATCRGKSGAITSIEEKIRSQPPGPPFSLGDLQWEAFHRFRYSPGTTQRAAEKLYLDAYISYPRTSSQKLPPTINPRDILRKLAENDAYKELAGKLLQKGRLKPRQGKKDDPAHPAIHPTGNLPRSLSKTEMNIYDLIVKRFMACLADPAVRQVVNADVDVNGCLFHLKGSMILERGWMAFYAPYVKEVETHLPKLREGQAIPVVKLSTRRRYTRPSARFNQSSLLKKMEDEGIGTKGTRTGIIETLYRRGYIEGNSIKITDLGFTIAEALRRYCPEILSIDLTRGLERDMEAIQTGETAGDYVVAEAVNTLKPLLEAFKENEEAIGREIDEALREISRKENTLGPCPCCETGEIVVLRNNRTGKSFAGCSNYKNGCSQTYPLPQGRKIYTTGESCPSCGAPVIKTYYKRKPWRLCINRDCPTKKRKDKDE